MCIGCWQKDEELKLVGKYVQDFLQGKSIADIANEEGVSKNVVLNRMDILRSYNPDAYEEIAQKLK